MAQSRPALNKPSRPPLLRALVLIAALATVTAAAFAIRGYWRRTTLDRAMRHGLEMLAPADTAPAILAALDAWEGQTGPRWQTRRDDLITHILKNYPLSDQRVRTLLTRISGADFGARREDWSRWLNARPEARAGAASAVPRRERVRLARRWQAPVGLTAWFSTIIPLDGQIYVASLGNALGRPDDPANGIVRVSGIDGTANLIFSPPSTGVTDVLGISAGDNCLFATCADGAIYCVEPDGALRWRVHTGGPLGSVPLTCDFNRDGVPDVIAARQSGHVVAVSGRTGRTAWTTSPVDPIEAPRGDIVAATVTLALISSGGEDHILVATPDGWLRVLSARTGAVRWRGLLPAGALAAPLACDTRRRGGPCAFVADRAARVWGLIATSSGFELVGQWNLRIHGQETVIAGLRALAQPDGPPWVVACPTATTIDSHAALCALEPGEVRWRSPLSGSLWATPAVADVNGNGRPELITACIGSDKEGNATGILTVLSANGHVLVKHALPAPVESSPVVTDVDGDQRLDVLIADQSGLLHCLTVGVAGPIEWGLVGGDSHNTNNQRNAYSFGQAPMGAQWRWRPE